MVSTSRDDCRCGSIVVISYDMMTRCFDQLTAANFRIIIAVKMSNVFFIAITVAVTHIIFVQNLSGFSYFIFCFVLCICYAVVVFSHMTLFVVLQLYVVLREFCCYDYYYYFNALRCKESKG